MNEENKEPVIIKLHPEPAEYLEAETAFLRAVGLCITRWAFVDRQLFWMFRFGLGAATHRAAIVYYNQQTISRRVAQADELLRNAFAERKWDSESEEWQRLRNPINELLPTRNIVAHQPVRRVGKSDGKRAVYEYSIYVEPFQRYLGKTYKGLLGKDALETKDLVDHANQVEDLETELMTFAQALVKKNANRGTL
jgi:hypothetical protein